MTETFDLQWRDERRFLTMLADGLDPYTLPWLQETGVGPGWRCLEVGAGSGSVARWLCGRVAPEGQVVAADLQTAFLQTVQTPGLEVRCLDIVRDDLEQAHYDLVHARHLLEYLPEREEAMRRMAGAVRPGGWLAIEAIDFLSCVPVAGEGAEPFERSIKAGLGFLRSAGFDPYCGRRVGEGMRHLGFQEVRVRGHCEEIGGSRPLTGAWPAVLGRLGDRLVKEGWLQVAELQALPGLMRRDDFAAISPTMFAVMGRRP